MYMSDDVQVFLHADTVSLNVRYFTADNWSDADFDQDAKERHIAEICKKTRTILRREPVCKAMRARLSAVRLRLYIKEKQKAEGAVNTLWGTRAGRCGLVKGAFGVYSGWLRVRGSYMPI